MKDGAIIKWLSRRSRQQFTTVVFLSVLNMVNAALGILMALYSKNVIDAALSDPDRTIVKKALCLLGLILIRLALSWLGKNLSGISEDRMTMNLRAYMMDIFMGQEYREISRCHTGELMTRITSDVNIISSNVVSLIPNILQFLTRLVCAYAVLYQLDHQFAITILLVGSVLFLVIQPMRPYMKRMHRKVQEKEGKLRSFMQEVLESQLVIRVFHVEDQVKIRMASLQEESYQIKRKRRYINSFANTGIQLVFQIGYIYALVWSAFHLGKGTISAGTLTAVLQLVNQIQNPLMNLSNVLPGVFAVLASAERLMEMEKKESRKMPALTDLTAEEIYHNLDAIEGTDITFAYAKGSEHVLEHADFTLNKQEFVSIVGPSGIGKSTLVKLLLGIYPLETGEIRLRMKDGSYLELPEELPGLYAYVPQGNCMFSGTIEETLCFFREGIQKEEIWEALRVTCADTFVKELPQGLHTVIGERGLGLSEGQLQRLAIARALLSGAPILLLDEATSALDMQTECRLLENLQAMKDKTCLFITHRAAAGAICTKEIRIQEKKLYIEER